MPAARTWLALGCLLALASGAIAEDTVSAASAKYGPTVYDCLRKAGLTSLIKIVDAAGMKSYFSTTYQINSLFAPNNAAVAQLYRTLQLPEQTALANKRLMLQLLKYNTIPYVRRTPYWPTKGNGFKKQKTLIPGMMLRLYTTSAGRLAVSGFANNATLIGKPGYNLVCARSVVHVTDGVLLPIEPGM
ncbi:hypothetical protein D9Q98_007141 [Chlorella vulgaris]|uniref:FAS1 domain-containing protein n=1 Tax=Chlorella vulgaris TaxID=3077 RepID=A0A9D4YUV7_CHLVU|nr:hypothetical protein D9Q98_007141 [Chlorella vulgaris]